jgi:hypothetical protein
MKSVSSHVTEVSSLGLATPGVDRPTSSAGKVQRQQWDYSLGRADIRSTMSAPSSAKSAQGSRVALELEILRQKQLAKSQRLKLKDSTLRSQRDKEARPFLTGVIRTCGYYVPEVYDLTLSTSLYPVGSPLTTPEEAKAFLAAMRNKSHEREFLHKPPSNISSDGMDSWFMQQRKREQELRERRKEAEALLRGYRGYGGGFSTPTSQAGSENLDDPSAGYYSSFSNGFQDTPPVRPSSARSDGGKRLPPMRFERSTNNHPDDEAAEEKKDSDDSVIQREQEAPSEPVEARPTNKPQPPAPLIIPPVEPHIPETVWRDFVSSTPGAKFPVESGRYHLYLSYACPGSHRALIVRALKGLEDAISVTYVHPTWRLTNPNHPQDKHRGW